MTTQRALLVTALLCFALALGAPTAAVLAQMPDATISVPEQRVGALHVGDPVSNHRRYVRQIGDEYLGGDGIVCQIDSRGRLSEIVVTSPRLVTERLIRVGSSTLDDVVVAYGKPETGRTDDEAILRYPDLGFEVRFPLRRGAKATDDLKVGALVLTSPQR